MSSRSQPWGAFLHRLLWHGDLRSGSRRSRLGLLLAVLMAPALLGVMACFELPAPVGDPEKSRIEPAMSGVWLVSSGELENWMFVFEPFDKRSWLGRLVILEPSITEESDIPEAEDGDGAPVRNTSSLESLRAGEVHIDGVLLLKAWRKRISGRSFLTFEFRGMLDAERGMEPTTWWVAEVKVDKNRLAMNFIDKEFDEIDEGMTRRQLERVIRRHLGNPDLFAGSDPVMLDRVPQQDYDILRKMFDDAGIVAAYE